MYSVLGTICMQSLDGMLYLRLRMCSECHSIFAVYSTVYCAAYNYYITFYIQDEWFVHYGILLFACYFAYSLILFCSMHYMHTIIRWHTIYLRLRICLKALFVKPGVYVYMFVMAYWILFFNFAVLIDHGWWTYRFILIDYQRAVNQTLNTCAS